MKHTKGPWYSIQLGRDVVSVDARPGAHDHEVICVPNKAENAHLIAAAPELLEAAKALVAEYKASPITPDCLILRTMDLLEDAIAKAEGK